MVMLWECGCMTLIVRLQTQLRPATKSPVIAKVLQTTTLQNVKHAKQSSKQKMCAAAYEAAPETAHFPCRRR